MVFVRDIYTVKAFLDKVQRPTKVNAAGDQHAREDLPGFSIPPTPGHAISESYEQLDKVIILFRSYRACYELVQKPPMENDLRAAQHYHVVDELMELVLILVDSVKDHGEMRLKLVRERWRECL